MIGGKPDAVPATAQAIGAAVRQLRRGRGWSLNLLAERSVVSYQYVSEIETGKRNFSIQVLERIAVALEVSLPTVVALACQAPRADLQRAA